MAVIPHNQTDSPMEALTRRERDVLAFLVENLSNREIAEALTIEPDSVKWYTKQIYAKLGVHDRQQATVRARALGLIASAAPLPCHLPATLTTFIGRQSDVEQVGKMLANPAYRLITLTGAGGVGKTRLALRVAEEICARGSHEIGLIELAAISNAAMVIETVSAGFGLHIEKDQTPLTILQNHLRPKKLLLVLDNCEHLVEPCASLAESLLKTCPRLQILATSREALGVSGEIPYCVPSLSIPETENFSDLEKLSSYEAVALFIERGQSALPGFALTPDNAEAVARICQRLDGIPLAIELAAARIQVLSVAQIADRLEESFALLSGGSRTALARHQTMRASIEWSHLLLTQAERLLLQRLSVFSGGWTLHAAEQICADAALPAEEIFSTLTQLIQKSLVQVEHTPNVRYFLLEMVRQFAREQARLAGEDEHLHDQHAQWFLAFAETADQKMNSGERLNWQTQVEADSDNLRAALQWSLAERANPEIGLRITHALTHCLWNRGEYRREGCRWLNMGLLIIPTVTPMVQARVLHSLAYLDITASPMARITWLESALDICRQLGAEGILDSAAMLSWEGLIEALDLGNPHRGLILLNQSEELLRKLGEPGKIQLSVTLERKSAILELLDEHAQALTCAHESITLDHAHGGHWITGELRALGNRALRQGDYTAAHHYYDEAIALAQLSGNILKVANFGKKIGDIEKAQGHHEQAFGVYGQVLQTYESVGWLTQPRSFAWLLECLALNEIAWAEKTSPPITHQHLIRAATILGAEQALLESVGLPIFVEQRQEYDQAILTLRTSLDTLSLEAARAEGRAMSVKEAVKFILETPEGVK
jgi:predicted ATPase/DNA-binding CsgD family transcriptional regulator